MFRLHYFTQMQASEKSIERASWLKKIRINYWLKSKQEGPAGQIQINSGIGELRQLISAAKLNQKVAGH